MDANFFKNNFLRYFEFNLTNGQKKLANSFYKFLVSKEQQKIFVLKGYAGTGKTTMLTAFSKLLFHYKLKSVMLAPTGRAAKVMTNYSKRSAYTIHRKIYQKIKSDDGRTYFSLSPNRHKNTLFIVDEASMIGSQKGNENIQFGSSGNLLEDLIDFVFSGINCHLVLIGDTAQLPPVGDQNSPALNLSHLRMISSAQLFNAELTEVVRQQLDSGILLNATVLRNNYKNQYPNFKINTNELDVVNISGVEFPDILEQSYIKDGENQVIVITRSNKRANIYNQQIRARCLWREEELESGDKIMVVKNNYFWLPEGSAVDFIANGDVLEIIRFKGEEDKHGFRFASVAVKLVDFPNQPEFDVKIILDTIFLDSPNLPYEDQQKLFASVQEEYLDIKSKSKRNAKIMADPYFNALQIKFSYAVTCHKSQGGQWPTVFVDQGYIQGDSLNLEHLRWLYTAVTRAQNTLYLVNFDEKFIQY